MSIFLNGANFLGAWLISAQPINSFLPFLIYVFQHIGQKKNPTEKKAKRYKLQELKTYGKLIKIGPFAIFSPVFVFIRLNRIWFICLHEGKVVWMSHRSVYISLPPLQLSCFNPNYYYSTIVFFQLKPKLDKSVTHHAKPTFSQYQMHESLSPPPFKHPQSFIACNHLCGAFLYLIEVIFSRFHEFKGNHLRCEIVTLTKKKTEQRVPLTRNKPVAATATLGCLWACVKWSVCLARYSIVNVNKQFQLWLLSVCIHGDSIYIINQKSRNRKEFRYKSRTPLWKRYMHVVITGDLLA